MYSLEKSFKSLIIIGFFLSSAAFSQDSDDADADAPPVSPIVQGLDRARAAVDAGDNAAAVAELEGLYDAGFFAVAFIKADATLGKLKGDAAFDALADKMEVKAYPCEHDDVFSEFDFWVGDWEVHTANGQFAGNNVITKEHRSCVLIENWVNASGSGGIEHQLRRQDDR